MLTLFSLISAPNETLQLLVEKQQFLSGIRNLWEWRKQDMPYITFLTSLEIFHPILGNMIFFPPRPDKYITLLLDLSKPLRAMFRTWVANTWNLQNMLVIPQQCFQPITFFFFAMRRSIWKVWCKVKRWQIIWIQTLLQKVRVKRRKESWTTHTNFLAGRTQKCWKTTQRHKTYC